MRYASGQTVRIGDEVLADGMTGEVVCDFDNREFAVGYEDWDMPAVDMVGGGRLDRGIMVKTVEAGLIHFPPDSGDIRFVRSSSPRP